MIAFATLVLLLKNDNTKNDHLIKHFSEEF
ncbi:hypothetical protein NG742_13470 [Carnobacterium divergens]|nr:hypothetical protein [Carnobacterium divergens]